MGISISVVVVVAILLIVATILLLRPYRTISFYDGFKLTNIPVVILEQNGKTYNFILDSGAANSCINSSVLKELNYRSTGYDCPNTGMTGETVIAKVVDITFKCRGYEINDYFLAQNYDSLFNTVKKETGVQLHGILGSRTFALYGYVLDYQRYAFYTATWVNLKNTIKRMLNKMKNDLFSK